MENVTLGPRAMTEQDIFSFRQYIYFFLLRWFKDRASVLDPELHWIRIEWVFRIRIRAKIASKSGKN